MNKKVKEFIASNKLSDEEILRRLMVESPPTDAEVDDSSEEDSEVEEESTTEIPAGEDDAPEEEEQLDIKALVQELVAEELAKLKGGKKPPKIKAKPVIPVTTFDYSHEFGAL